MEKESDLIQLLKLRHDEKYEYGDLNNKKLIDFIEIFCPSHGMFSQQLGKHKIGQGCKKCQGENRRITFKDFLEKSRKVHGEIYEYIESSFTMAINPMEIICKIHGKFVQKPYKHYRGQGCPKCGNENRNDSSKLKFAEFEKQARLIHGNRYIYHKETFTVGNAITTITCRIHGDFQQNALGHIHPKLQNNCPKCSFKASSRKSSRAQRLPFEEFVRRSRKVFGEKYIYVETTYEKITSKVVIDCPDHGPFEIQALDHTKGNGCPRCSFARSRPERLIRSILEEMSIDFKEQWKSETLKSPNKRPLPFDFYIPAMNLIIEYDGRHHYYPSFSSDPVKAQEILRRTQANDLLKNNWAKDNGYLLHRLSNERHLEKELLILLEKHSIL